MGSSQRLAAVAAVSHSKHYYNHTQPEVGHSEVSTYTVNIFFVSATLCGVLVAVCAACWRRSPASDKPEEAPHCRGVYTVSADATLVQLQLQADVPGPPPAYETVVDIDVPLQHKPGCPGSKELLGPYPQCHAERSDGGLPSYEAAVLLKDTKL